MIVKFAIFTLFSSWILVTNGPISKKGLVLSVHDGDSIMLLSGGETIKTRLLYIDAPELKQSCEQSLVGMQARKTLQDLILNRVVSFHDLGLDIYGRHLVEVFYQNQSINLAMVALGAATLYAYSRYQSVGQKQTFLNAFWQAKKNNKGLHQCRILESPWHFRKKQKTVSQKRKLL